MMNKNCRKAWHEFCQTISPIYEQDTAPLIFHYLRTWYQENKMLLSRHLIDEYGLENLIILTLILIQLNARNVPKIIKPFLDLAPSSEQSMVAILRDQFWELVVLSVDVECQRCGKLELCALFDTEEKKLY
jgi:predicted restriction endonuclease